MKKILLCLFVVISLLAAPTAHATNMSCEGYNCSVFEQSKQQNDNKIVAAEHHYCCLCVSVAPDLTLAKAMKVSNWIVFAFEQNAIKSVIVGLPIKPPSTCA